MKPILYVNSSGVAKRGVPKIFKFLPLLPIIARPGRFLTTVKRCQGGQILLGDLVMVQAFHLWGPCTLNHVLLLCYQ